MGIANGYDETSSEGIIKLLKTSFNVLSDEKVGEALKVIELSVNNDKEGIKEFCKRKREEKAQSQIVARKEENKSFSLEDFEERD